MNCRARRVPHTKWSIVDCIMVVVALALVAVIVSLLPRAIAIEDEMAAVRTQQLQSSN